MRSILFRALAGAVAGVLGCGAVVLIVMGEGGRAVPVIAMSAFFGGYAVLGEERSRWMFQLVFGVPPDAITSSRVERE